MNHRYDDEKLEDGFKRWTAVDQDIQNETWEKIDQHLFPKQNKSNFIRRHWVMAVSTAAIIIIAMFGIMTEPGQAVVQEIKDLFVAEKEQNIVMEGQREITDVELHTNDKSDYVIYVDKDYYKIEQLDGVDRIVTKEPLGEDYPEVYMEIIQEIGKSKDVVIEEVKTKLKNDGMPIIHEDTVSEPVDSIILEGFEKDEVTGHMRNNWDSMIHKYLIVEVSSEQFFVIKQVYFLEASEGHGARFDHMLNSFEIIH